MAGSGDSQSLSGGMAGIAIGRMPSEPAPAMIGIPIPMPGGGGTGGAARVSDPRAITRSLAERIEANDASACDELLGVPAHLVMSGAIDNDLLSNQIATMVAKRHTAEKLQATLKGLRTQCPGYVAWFDRVSAIGQAPDSVAQYQAFLRERQAQGIAIPAPSAPAASDAAGIAIGFAPDQGESAPIGIAIPQSAEDEAPPGSLRPDSMRADIQPPGKVTRDLMQRIHDQDEEACFLVLGIRESDVLQNKITDPSVLVRQIRLFSERLAEQEKAGTFKQLADSFRKYCEWRDKIREIGRSADPIGEFRKFAEPRQEARAYALLLTDARAHVRDGVLEWSEQQNLKKYAEELGLTLAHCNRAYDEAIQERISKGGTPVVRHSKPPPPTAGWRAYTVLGGGDDDVWGMQQLLDAIMENFPKAVECAMESEDRITSLAGYLTGCLGPEAKAAQKIAVTARRSTLTDQLDPTAAIWQFLWSNGRPTLHLDSKKQPAAKKNRRVDDLEGLRGALESSASVLDTTGNLLAAGLLEKWLSIVAEQPQAAAVAKTWREKLRGVPKSKLEGEQRRAVLETLWAAGIYVLPLRHDSGKSVTPVRTIGELVSALEQYPTWKFFSWALEAGVISGWVKLVDPSSLRPTEEARQMGHLGTASWLWKHGSRKLSLGTGQPTVESLDQLLYMTDSGEAMLLDEVLTEGELSVWAREILRRPDLAQAADEIRADKKGSKAERWRQQAGARTYKVKGQPADTPAAFAALALVAHEQGDVAGEDAPPGWWDLDAALKSELPMRRFVAANPDLAAGLQAISEMAGSPRDRALAACLSAGLTSLPVSDGTIVHVIVQDLADLAARIHTPGLRAEVARLLQSGVLMWWIPNCMQNPPAGLLDYVVARYRDCQTATHEQKLAMVDGIVRLGLGVATCYVAPGLEARDYAQLQAIATDVVQFGVLANPEVRERIREACGRGALILPGIQDVPSSLSEQDLEDIPGTARAMMFAWEWLKVPVLWLGRVPYRAVSVEELLGHLADPEARSAVQDAAVSGLLGLWLGSQMSMEIPDEFLSQSGMGGAGVHESSFPAFALWVGDSRPELQLTLSQSSKGLEEGGRSSVGFQIRNLDSFRVAPLIITAKGANLDLLVNATNATSISEDSIRLDVAPDTVTEGTLQVHSREGHAGKMSVQLAARFHVPGEDRNAAEAQLSIAVRFPAVRVLKAAGVGIVLGVVAALVVCGVLHIIFAQNSLLALIPKGGDLRDVNAEMYIGAGLMALAVFVQRLILAKKHQLLPTSNNSSVGAKVMAYAALALAPIGSMHGCVVGCGKGSGLSSCNNGISGCAMEGAGGAGIGVAIGLFVLLRPGAVYKEFALGLPQDLLFLALCLAGIFGGSQIGAGLTFINNSLDLASISTVMSFGITPTLDVTSVFIGFGIWGAVIGLALGLANAFSAIERRAVGWAALLVIPALLVALVGVRTSPAQFSQLYPERPADEKECRAALVVAMDAMKALAPGTDPDPAVRLAAYKATPAYQKELDAVTALCAKRQLRKSDLACLSKATAPADVRQCNPFWMEVAK